VRPLRAVAPVVAAAAIAVASGCGGSGSSAVPTSTAAAVPTGPETTPQGSHDAPELEAQLPRRVAGVRLERGSATGDVVLAGGSPFAATMAKLLEDAGKQPSDLRWANARDPQGTVEVEVGAFEVSGMTSAELARAIVEASRPGAPGLRVSEQDFGPRRVTTIVYPSGTRLHLYEHGDVVFYVGAQQDALVRKALAALP
jgi:hypothetical protein